MPAIDAIVAPIVGGFLTLVTVVLLYFTFVLSPVQDVGTLERDEEPAELPEGAGAETAT